MSVFRRDETRDAFDAPQEAPAPEQAPAEVNSFMEGLARREAHYLMSRVKE